MQIYSYTKEADLILCTVALVVLRAERFALHRQPLGVLFAH